MLATYHNHSTWSDGRAPVAAMVEAARGLGLDELGVSDHYLVLAKGEVPPSWGLPTAQLPAYLDELRSYADATVPVVRVGLEVDWIPERQDAIAQLLGDLDLDHVIGSVHMVGEFCVDASAERWQRLDEPARDAVHRRYWQEARAMAASGLFDIAAHLDLPKKFAFHPTVNLDAEIDAALDAIARAGMVVEINTAGWHKPCRDAYPTLDILRRCRARDIPVTISADAHKPEDLVRDFRRAAARLAEAGYGEVARFRGREIILDPLDAAIDGLPAEPDHLEPDDF